MADSYWETLLDWRDEQWDMYSAEYEEWLDSQPPSRPEPEDCDPDYEDDFQILITAPHGEQRPY